MFLKTKTALTLLLSAATAISATAHAADTDAFTGLSISGSINLSSTTVGFDGTTGDGSNWSFEGLGKQSISGAIGADYGFAFGSSGVLKLGGTYDLTKPEFFSITLSDGTDSGSIKGKLKSGWSIFVAPGVAINPQTLVYAKLSYRGGKAEITGESTLTDSGSVSQSVKGIGYGAGVRVAVTKNIFIGVEAERVNYNDEALDGANYSTGTTIGSLQLGYKF